MEVRHEVMDHVPSAVHNLQHAARDIVPHLLGPAAEDDPVALARDDDYWQGQILVLRAQRERAWNHQAAFHHGRMDLRGDLMFAPGSRYSHQALNFSIISEAVVVSTCSPYLPR